MRQISSRRSLNCIIYQPRTNFTSTAVKPYKLASSVGHGYTALHGLRKNESAAVLIMKSNSISKLCPDRPEWKMKVDGRLLGRSVDRLVGQSTTFVERPPDAELNLNT